MSAKCWPLPRLEVGRRSRRYPEGSEFLKQPRGRPEANKDPGLASGTHQPQVDEVCSLARLSAAEPRADAQKQEPNRTTRLLGEWAPLWMPQTPLLLLVVQHGLRFALRIVRTTFGRAVGGSGGGKVGQESPSSGIL